MNRNKLVPAMPGKEPFHSSTFGYTVVGLGVALVSSVLFTPLGNVVAKRLMDRFGSEQHPESSSVRPTTTSTLDPASSGLVNTQPAGRTQVSAPTDRRPQVEGPPTDPQSASLSLEYDSLKERLSAVDQSIMQRASDLGSLPEKPEITAALGTAKADLAATEQALQDRKWNVAKQRMERIKKTLNYLESL